MLLTTCTDWGELALPSRPAAVSESSASHKTQTSRLQLQWQWQTQDASGRPSNAGHAVPAAGGRAQRLGLAACSIAAPSAPAAAARRYAGGGV